MGITHLWSLLEPAGEDLPFDKMRGMKVAIDASMWAHRFAAVSKYASRDQTDMDQHGSHIEHFTRNILKLLHYGIRPVFVFDGPAPLLKRKVMKKRAKDNFGPKFTSLAQQLLQKSIVQGKKRKICVSDANAANGDGSSPAVDTTGLVETFRKSQTLDRLPRSEQQPRAAADTFSFNMSSFLTTSVEPSDMAQYKGDLQKYSNPSRFSSKQMHRFIQAVNFEQEKRSYAENEENAFRVQNIPGEVDVRFRQREDTEEACESQCGPKLKKDMMGIVRGKKGTFFYLGPVGNNKKGVDNGEQIGRKETPNEIQMSEGVLTAQQTLAENSVDAAGGFFLDDDNLSDTASTLSDESFSVHLDEELDRKSVLQASEGPKISQSQKVVTQDTDEEHLETSDDLKSSQTSSQNSFLEKVPFDEYNTVKVEDSVKTSAVPLHGAPHTPDDEELWTEVKIEPDIVASLSVVATPRVIEAFPETRIDEMKVSIAEDKIANAEASPHVRFRDDTPKPPDPPSFGSSFPSNDFSIKNTGTFKDINRAVGDLMTLCALFGIPTIHSPGEAEAQCASLNRMGIVDAVVTDDSDAFLFGAKCVIRNFFHKSKSFPQHFDIERIQTLISLDRVDFLVLGFILGGDYMEGLKGVGVVKSLPMLAAFRDCDHDISEKNGDSQTDDTFLRESVEECLRNVIRHAKKSASDIEYRPKLTKITRMFRKNPTKTFAELLQNIDALKDEGVVHTYNSEAFEEEVIDFHQAIEILRKLLIVHLFAPTADIELCLPESLHDLDDHRGKKTTEFSFRYILNAYLRPNVHLNIDEVSWGIPQWSKLTRFLHDTCGHRYRVLEQNVFNLQQRYRRHHAMATTSQLQPVSHRNMESIERLVGRKGVHLKPKFRRLFLVLRSIREQKKTSSISLETLHSWFVDLTQAPSVGKEAK